MDRHERKLELNGTEELMAMFGNLDNNIKVIGNKYNVEILNRGADIKISGDVEGVDRAYRVLHGLSVLCQRGETITEHSLNYLIGLVDDGGEQELIASGSDVLCITASGKPIKPKTLGQRKYIDELKKNTVTFGIGPAGTGKTYLAVAVAVYAFRMKQVSRIIITRPAVEAGEKLGFLPGDMLNKVDPYLRPLYDALYDIMGMESFTKYIEKGIIEVAPLAYMRGRTLDDSYIILDEAQNTTSEQMKMFLTRLGFGSKAIITGDITQVDLPFGKKSGLKEITKILKNIDDISFCYLTEKDVVRHPLVQKIVKAYESAEAAMPKETRPNRREERTRRH